MRKKKNSSTQKSKPLSSSSSSSSKKIHVPQAPSIAMIRPILPFLTPTKVPEIPKRPANPFLLYYRDLRPQLAAQNPNLPMKSLSKIIADRWKNLSSEAKAKYTTMAALLKEEYWTARSVVDDHKEAKSNKKMLFPKLTSSTTTEALESLVNATQSLPSIKKPTGPRKDPDQPKHPTSAFLHFLSEVRPTYSKLYPKSSTGSITKMISAAWKLLKTEERAKYEEMATKDKQRYQEEMKEWHRRRGETESVKDYHLIPEQFWDDIELFSTQEIPNEYLPEGIVLELETDNQCDISLNDDDCNNKGSYII